MNAVAPGLRSASNPVVFFDVTVGGVDVGRVKMELFADVVPVRPAARQRGRRLPCRRTSHYIANLAA